MKAKTVGMMTAVLLVGLSSGYAAEPEGWKFEVTPYAWLAGMEGDVTVNGHKAEFDKSFTDLIDAVGMAGSLLGTVQYDRYLLWGQVDYFSMSTDNMDADSQPKGGSLDTKMLLGEVAAGYQVDGWMEGQTFDLLVGVRELHMETDLTINHKGSFSKDNDIVDPIFLVRPSIPIFPSKINGLRFNPTLGIGAGGDSDLVYELQPQFQYQITPNIAARLGYRRVGYKFKGNHNSDNEMNIALAGVIAGIGVTF
ncbi:MAG: hypothetical protein WCS52_09880 [bacterium]